MAWRRLPPRLRGRVPRVGLLIALPATIGTIAFGLIWLLGPFVLLGVLISDERRLLAALLAPVALWWLYQMIREPLVPGLLFAAPHSIWSVVQQQRGMVDTEDLEQGRLVGLLDWRGLTSAERAALRILVEQVPQFPELAEQVEHCEVMAECVCGCASIRLYATSATIPRDAARGNAHGEQDNFAIAAVGTDAAGREVDVVLHIGLGSMRELEVTTGGLHDGTADAIPAADTLRPAGIRHTRWDP
jgi:hypothetical protein